ncbi:hypothetical protein ABAC460_22855 [Asticcacaulis sp. AC460]|uniref:DUF3237 domain-containing protein n=1 Tax=Asticcacaulis sp. AC460 TaxID=1282360 RepID=UPI0003C3F9BC|nr:DUF3237 domain-containing protein [Asticcacaulis sp. AC460]ESQ86671.1 hypothetical protein ABAC460_22855 [Asticcacaulis sp. AC460]
MDRRQFSLSLAGGLAVGFPAAAGELELRPLCEITARLLPPVDIGEGPQGRRRVISISGGEVVGERLRGVVLPGGADFQRIRPDAVTEIQARYVIETHDGFKVYVENTGLRHAPPEVMARLMKGEVVDPALVYFRSAPRFEAPDGPYTWLERSLFLCSGARYPEHVVLRFFEVT